MHLVFDVNETLLDTRALDPLFQRWFDSEAARPEWFLTLQERWMTTNLIGRFEPFSGVLRHEAEDPRDPVRFHLRRNVYEG